MVVLTSFGDKRRKASREKISRSCRKRGNEKSLFFSPICFSINVFHFSNKQKKGSDHSLTTLNIFYVKDRGDGD